MSTMLFNSGITITSEYSEMTISKVRYEKLISLIILMLLHIK